MMKKKILSALTALCCAVGCCYCPAVFAEETLPSQEYIVVAVDNEEAPENFVIMNPDDPGTYLWLSVTDIDRFLAEGEESIEFGDILLLEGEMIWTGREGINSFYFVDENGETTDDAGCIYNTGSVLDGSTETFTVTTYENASYDSLGEHKCYFNYIYSDGCVQPGCVDWSTVESGDSVTCITYNGVPVLPVSVTRLGDFNTDGEINAMDATHILMAAAAAGAGTEALSTASETAASPIGDVNADGEVNAMDATIVLVYAARNGAGTQVSVSEVAAELMS